jgi:hypothetical protein
VIERGQIRDARCTLVLDRGQEASLRERQRDTGPLRRQAVESSHHGEQVRAKSPGHLSMVT